MEEEGGSRLTAALEQVCAAERKFFDKGDLSRVSSSLKTAANALAPVKLLARVAQPSSCSGGWRRAPAGPAQLPRWTRGGAAPSAPLAAEPTLPQLTPAALQAATDGVPRGWDREETEQLWRIFEICEGNLIAAHDRHSAQFPARSLEDVQAQLHALLAALGAPPPDPLTYEQAVARRVNAEKLFRRVAASNAEESALLAEIGRCEALVRQRERHNKAFQRIVSMPLAEQTQVVAQRAPTAEEFLAARAGETLACNAGATLTWHTPQLSALQNKKMELALRKLDLLGRVEATPASARLFAEVKAQLLLLLALNQQLEQRQEQLRGLGAPEPEAGAAPKRVKEG